MVLRLVNYCPQIPHETAGEEESVDAAKPLQWFISRILRSNVGSSLMEKSRFRGSDGAALQLDCDSIAPSLLTCDLVSDLLACCNFSISRFFNKNNERSCRLWDFNGIIELLHSISTLIELRTYANAGIYLHVLGLIAIEMERELICGYFNAIYYYVQVDPTPGTSSPSILGNYWHLLATERQTKYKDIPALARSLFLAILAMCLVIVDCFREEKKKKPDRVFMGRGMGKAASPDTSRTDQPNMWVNCV